MKKAIIHLTIALLAVGSGFAQHTILFKNGDSLTGTIIKQDHVHVYFKPDAFGPVSLNMADIKDIRNPEKKAEEDAVPTNKVVAKEDPKKTKAVDSVAREPKKMKYWSGQAGLSVAMRQKTRSNTSGIIGEDKLETYHIYGDLNWKGKRNDLRWDWKYRYSEDEDEVRDDYLNLAQRYSHSFEEQALFATAKTIYQRDYNRRIDNEYLQTAELGIKWFEKDSKIELKTSAGGGYHRYERMNKKRTESTAVSQPQFIFDQSLKITLINSLSLKQKYTHLGNAKDYHSVLSAGLENRLLNNLFLRVEYCIDRDTEVLYDDKGYYDKALLTSLLYKF